MILTFHKLFIKAPDYHDRDKLLRFITEIIESSGLSMEYNSVTNSTDIDVKLVQPTESPVGQPTEPELGCLPGLTEPLLVPVTDDDIKEMAAVWLEFVIKNDSIKPDN